MAQIGGFVRGKAPQMAARERAGAWVPGGPRIGVFVRGKCQKWPPGPPPLIRLVADQPDRGVKGPDPAGRRLVGSRGGPGGHFLPLSPNKNPRFGPAWHPRTRALAGRHFWALSQYKTPDLGDFPNFPKISGNPDCKNRQNVLRNLGNCPNRGRCGGKGRGGPPSRLS